MMCLEQTTLTTILQRNLGSTLKDLLETEHWTELKKWTAYPQAILWIKPSEREVTGCNLTV